MFTIRKFITSHSSSASWLYRDHSSSASLNTSGTGNKSLDSVDYLQLDIPIVSGDNLDLGHVKVELEETDALSILIYYSCDTQYSLQVIDLEKSNLTIKSKKPSVRTKVKRWAQKLFTRQY